MTLASVHRARSGSLAGLVRVLPRRPRTALHGNSSRVGARLQAGSALVETGAVVHLGIVLDLSVLVPAYAVATAVLLRSGGLAGPGPRVLPIEP